MTQTQQFPCTTCNAVFNTTQELMEHERVHSKGTIYYDCTCGARFTSPKEFGEHTKSHQK